MEKKQVSKSICIVYCTEKQIVTKTFLSHSGFVFAVAKIGKKSGFGKKKHQKTQKNTTFFTSVLIKALYLRTIRACYALKRINKQLEYVNIQKGTKSMLATANIEDVTLSLPNADLAMLRLISRKMGWKLKTRRKSGLEKALDDVASGRVYEAKSFEDLIEQLEK